MSAITLHDIQVRHTLAPGDLGYIAYLHGDIYAKECNYGLNFEMYVLDGLKEFARAYDVEKDKLWICEHAGKIMGCMVVQHRGEQLQLRYFLFLPAYRGIGLGKYLVQEFVQFMKERKIQYGFLWTTSEQLAAISLYTRFGFRLTEEKNSQNFDKPVVEQRYDLTLP
ncbi:peptidyl-dipeptidase Dcp [Chitinophaga skermanii]|uniref:Peptidyl-dipeptidase Dcp n=1 Tax=Chitinophaga skermanii TaxID=331697 RepID=A0A327QYX7_9BACT|nr:GNAT family N-acetyltransferase [Chitinophaga skermanii]RAJ08633.1 peptidyl-dipeptidase Dcp [Chitinophaga skermanii]